MMSVGEHAEPSNHASLPPPSRRCIIHDLEMELNGAENNKLFIFKQDYYFCRLHCRLT
ncbi:MAG: hypothetical protein ABFD50_18305 [Smithella sp.]